MINKLFLPAIKILNRLTYSYKLVAIMVIFLIPLIFLTGLQLDVLNKKQIETRKALMGLDKLKVAIGITKT